MAVITLNYHDLTALMGISMPMDELMTKIPMIGADLDSVDGDDINMEFFPNRPDMYSVEGAARALRAFLGDEKGPVEYEVTPSDVEFIVEDSVKDVRPYFYSALITDVTMTDELIKSMMELQEKLHLTLGRKRKKVAIGLHDYDKIKGPFYYRAVDPESVTFVPLAEEREMDLYEILRKHEKGVEYAWVLEEFNRYPVIVDSNGDVLSFPPIINGERTTVTETTTNILLDLTGTDKSAVNTALNIIVTALAERGGKIHSVNVKYPDEEQTLPDLSPSEMPLSLSYINRMLGTSLSAEEAIEYLEKMRYGAIQKDEDTITIGVPAYRNDILHPIDLVEDIAIGIGYENITPVLPKQATFGRPRKIESLSGDLRSLLIGQGYLEMTTLTLSSEEEQFGKMRLEEGQRTQIANPITEGITCARVSLLPSLMMILKENRHRDLPQRIFEIGDVVLDHHNVRHLAALSCHPKASFTEMKSSLLSLFRDIGKRLEIMEDDDPSFISGRCAAIMIDGEKIGVFGELHPETITNFSLATTTAAFELDITKL